MKSTARQFRPNFTFLASTLAGGLVGLYSRSPQPRPDEVLRFTAFFVIGVLVVTGIRLVLQRTWRER